MHTTHVNPLPMDSMAARSWWRGAAATPAAAGIVRLVQRTHSRQQSRHVHACAPAPVAPSQLARFQPIGLAQLNATADMLVRRDNKYVVRTDVLQAAMTELARHFDILEIDGRREFGYATCYFDDRARTSYFDHHRGRRIRCKVRMRKYVDAGLCFVEVKLKHKRGTTIKKRLARPLHCHGKLDDEARTFIADCYRELYGREFGLDLQPALDMRYRRITLVAKQGGERMTIDSRLTFHGQGNDLTVDDRLCVVETKSANANGIADKVLRALHQHPTNSCSKYCVGMAALAQVPRYNKFLVALRRLQVLPTNGGQAGTLGTHDISRAGLWPRATALAPGA